METTINQRIKKIVEKHYNGSVNALAKASGISQSTLKDIVGEKANKPGYDTIIKILKAEYDDLLGEISPEWLLFGKGNMYSKTGDPTLGELPEPTVGIQAEACSINYKLVPLMNLDAVGGMHSLNTIFDNSEYVERLIPFTDAQEGDIALVVSGNSMDPTCPAGSKILIREVKNWKEYFGFGNIFVIHLTDNRRVLKEVQKYPEDSKNYVLCKSHNDKYPEEELPKSMIKSVWKVVKILNERGW